MKTVHYDMEGRILPAREGCCSSIVVWLILVTALAGGFAVAIILSVGPSVCSSFSEEIGTRSEKVAFVRGEDDEEQNYFVISERNGIFSDLQQKNLDELASCMPAESKLMVQAAPAGHFFLVNNYYNSEGRCTFGFLMMSQAFDDDDLVHALVQQTTAAEDV